MLQRSIEAEAGEVQVIVSPANWGEIGKYKIVTAIDEISPLETKSKGVRQKCAHLIQCVEAQVAVEREYPDETAVVYRVAENAYAKIVVSIGVFGEKVVGWVVVIDEQGVQNDSSTP